MPTLSELAFMYNTDKLEHGYTPFYEQHLPKNPKKILEIGIKEGNSARMWQHYFPEAEFHGLDIFIEYPIPSIPGIHWHKGHQCDYYLMEKLRNENFDVIIDDGSHNARDQMISFFGLFNGSHYFIEDLHCNEDFYYQQGLPYQFSAAGLFGEIGNSKWGGNAQNFNFQIHSGKNIILIKNAD